MPLLRERALGLTRRLAEITGTRSASSTRCGSWFGQRLFGLVPGYEDLNDHDELRDDSLLTLAGNDLTGENRVRERDRGHPLAPEPAGRARRARPVQEGRHEGDGRSSACSSRPRRRRRASWPSTAPTTRCTATRRAVSSKGTTAATCRRTSSAATMRCARVAATSTGRRGRNWRASSNAKRWPKTKIVVRGDGGPRRGMVRRQRCRDLFGLSRNARLTKRVGRQLRRSRSRCVSTGEASRRFCDFRYRIRRSWSRARRAVAKAEWRLRGARFVVTSLSRKRARVLYEKPYCARGENGIKEQQLVRRPDGRSRPCSPAPLLCDFRQQ